MKRHISVAFLLVLVMVSLVASALGYEDAFSKIHVYTQNNYTSYSSGGYDITSYTGSSKKTLKQNGCCAFTFAHAIQWLEGIKYDTNDTWSGLLYSLLKVSNKPSGEGLGKYKSALENGMTIYSNSGKTTKTVKFKRVTVSSSTTPTVDWIKNHFDKGGVIITHLQWDKSTGDSDAGGHYLLAVGYTIRNGICYIQMVDSSSWSTVNRVKSYDYSTFNVTTSLTGGKQYWIPLSAFTKKNVSYNSRIARIWFEYAFLPNNNIKPEYIELNSSTASLNLSDTLTLSAQAYPAGSSNSVTWKSSDDSVATVNNGVVTPHKSGQSVTITATSTIDSNITATCRVTTYYSGSGTLKFNNVSYPHVYAIGKSFTYSGSVESDVDLSSIKVVLYTTSTSYTQNITIPSGTKIYQMSSVGDALYKKLSAGRYWFYIEASDVMGRKIGFSNDSSASSSVSSHTIWKTNRQYTRPELVGSIDYNEHHYEVYSVLGGGWDVSNAYANEIGGHLVTFSDESELAAVGSYCNTLELRYLNIGAKYSNGTWSWVDGTPFSYHPWISNVEADGNYQYTPVGSIIYTSGKWVYGKATQYEMQHFIVEFDPIMVEMIILDGEDTIVAGNTSTYTGTVFPLNASNPNIKYSSSDTSIATINQNTGLVTALKEGYVTITATAQDGSNVNVSRTIYVQSPVVNVTGVEIYTDSELYAYDNTIIIGENKNFTLDSVVFPSNATYNDVYYYSSDPEIAYVEDYSSVVKTLQAGECNLIVCTYDGNYEDVLHVIVQSTSGACGDDVTWEYENGTLTISGTGEMYDYYNDVDGDIDRPWKIYQKDIDTLIVSEGITSIGMCAFLNCRSLKDASLPSTLNTINQLAFHNCYSLSNLNLQEGTVFIASGAFENCTSLTSVNIPASVQYLDPCAFLSDYFTDYYVDEQNPYYCSIDGILFSKDESTLVNYPSGRSGEYAIPVGTRVISLYAFYCCTDLTRVDIPETVQEIGCFAFRKSGLREIDLPNGIKVIEPETFAFCENLEIVRVPKTVVEIDENAFYNSELVTIQCYEGSQAYNYALSYGIPYILIEASQFEPDFIMPVELEYIDEEAFSGIAASCIKLSDSVTRIDAFAFANCPNLIAIYIPEECSKIASTAFDGIEHLTIYGIEGSYAEWYASKLGFDFVSVE